MTEPNSGTKRMMRTQTNLSFPSDGSLEAQSVSIHSQKMVAARDISTAGTGNGRKMGKGRRNIVVFSLLVLIVCYWRKEYGRYLVHYPSLSLYRWRGWCWSKKECGRYLVHYLWILLELLDPLISLVLVDVSCFDLSF